MEVKGKMTAKIAYPKQAQFFLTEVCPEGCPYCPYGHQSAAEKKRLLKNELSIVNWQKATTFLYEIMKIKFFCFIGGEPVLKKGLPELLAFITRTLPSATVILSTSGIPLLRNPKLLDELIAAGLKNLVVSVNGLGKLSPGSLDKELQDFQKGVERKTYLGLCFLQELKRKYPKEGLILSANCLVNKNLLPDLLPTYEYLAREEVYLNLCPEQTICFKSKTKPTWSVGKRRLLNRVMRQFLNIKEQKNNFLIPSKAYLQALALTGAGQPYYCSSEEVPNTLNLVSDGSLPFCVWRRGELGAKYTILDLMRDKKNYLDWLKDWQSDSGSTCACSWSFLDRVGAFGLSKKKEENNFWHKFI